MLKCKYLFKQRKCDIPLLANGDICLNAKCENYNRNVNAGICLACDKATMIDDDKKNKVKIVATSAVKRILKHECMNCTLKHLATARELLYRKDDMIMVLGHLACAYNHSGIKAIDTLLNNYQNLNPADITPVIGKLNLEQEFVACQRSEQSSDLQCIEYLAISAVIAIEIATGYSTEEYHMALLGNLSIAQDLAVLKNAELANRIRGIRLWLYPDGVRVAKFRQIDVALIKDMAEQNFTIPEQPKQVNHKPCRTCGKHKGSTPNENLT
jgi:hypothetical protein